MNKARVNILSLILDDDHDTLELIQGTLELQGITNFKIFQSVKEFLANLTADIHICVVDYYLDAQFNGYEILLKIKEKNKHSCVIIMSGMKNPDIIIQCLNKGCSYWVDKNKSGYLMELAGAMNTCLDTILARLELINFLGEKMDSHPEPHY